MLDIGYRRSFPKLNRACCGVDHSPPLALRLTVSGAINYPPPPHRAFSGILRRGLCFQQCFSYFFFLEVIPKIVVNISRKPCPPPPPPWKTRVEDAKKTRLLAHADYSSVSNSRTILAIFLRTLYIFCGILKLLCIHSNISIGTPNGVLWNECFAESSLRHTALQHVDMYNMDTSESSAVASPYLSCRQSKHSKMQKFECPYTVLSSRKQKKTPATKMFLS
jgi:hypothetical protein